MTSMMMLGITMEVSINKSLPIKGKTQAKLGHSWALLETLGYSLFQTFLALALRKLYSFGLWAKFTEIQNNLLDKYLI